MSPARHPVEVFFDVFGLGLLGVLALLQLPVQLPAGVEAPLSPEERAAAPILHKALAAARTAYDGGEREGGVLRGLMEEVLAIEPDEAAWAVRKIRKKAFDAAFQGVDLDEFEAKPTPTTLPFS